MTLRGVPVLQYDGLGTSPPAGVDAKLASHWIPPVSLARQLVTIRESGHRVVKLYDAWTRGGSEQSPRASVVLTFDDGRAADYEIALPLLLAAGMRAEFFINTARVGRPGGRRRAGGWLSGGVRLTRLARPARRRRREPGDGAPRHDHGAVRRDPRPPAAGLCRGRGARADHAPAAAGHAQAPATRPRPRALD